MSYNSKVTKHSYGISGRSALGRTSNGIDAREFMQNRNRENAEVVIESSVLAQDNIVKKAALLENVNSGRIAAKQSSFIMGDMYKTGRDHAFKHVMGSVFEACLVLDDNYKEENSANIRFVMESYIDANGGISLLENALKTNKTKFLTDVLEACNKSARKCAKRKVKESQESEQSVGIEFDMTPEEKEELDTDVSSMDVEQLASVVKDKVVTVIQEEKTRAIEKDEFEKELAEGDEDAIVKEQVFRANNKYCSAKHSLFNAFMTESYKDVLESVAQFDISSGVDDVEEIGLDEDDVDYDDKIANSLEDLNKSAKETLDDDVSEENDFDNISDDYDDDSALTESYGVVPEEMLEEARMLAAEEMVFEANSKHIDFQTKTLEKQSALQEKISRIQFKKMSLEKLKALKVKKTDAQKDFQEKFDEYDSKGISDKVAANLLHLVSGGFSEFLPAKHKTKVMLNKALWMSRCELTVINELIKEKSKAVKESMGDITVEEMEELRAPCKLAKRTSKAKKNAVLMDNVMAEALTKYTLLETLYTVQLENYTTRDIMDLSVRLTKEK